MRYRLLHSSLNLWTAVCTKWGPCESLHLLLVDVISGSHKEAAALLHTLKCVAGYLPGLKCHQAAQLPGVDVPGPGPVLLKHCVQDCCALQ